MLLLCQLFSPPVSYDSIRRYGSQNKQSIRCPTEHVLSADIKNAKLSSNSTVKSVLQLERYPDELIILILYCTAILNGTALGWDTGRGYLAFLHCDMIVEWQVEWQDVYRQRGSWGRFPLMKHLSCQKPKVALELVSRLHSPN